MQCAVLRPVATFHPSLPSPELFAGAAQEASLRLVPLLMRAHSGGGGALAAEPADDA